MIPRRMDQVKKLLHSNPAQQWYIKLSRGTNGKSLTDPVFNIGTLKLLEIKTRISCFMYPSQCAT